MPMSTPDDDENLRDRRDGVLTGREPVGDLGAQYRHGPARPRAAFLGEPPWFCSSAHGLRIPYRPQRGVGLPRCSGNDASVSPGGDGSGVMLAAGNGAVAFTL